MASRIASTFIGALSAHVKDGLLTLLLLRKYIPYDDRLNSQINRPCVLFAVHEWTQAAKRDLAAILTAILIRVKSTRDVLFASVALTTRTF